MSSGWGMNAAFCLARFDQSMPCATPRPQGGRRRRPVGQKAPSARAGSGAGLARQALFRHKDTPAAPHLEELVELDLAGAPVAQALVGVPVIAEEGAAGVMPNALPPPRGRHRHGPGAATGRRHAPTRACRWIETNEPRPPVEELDDEVLALWADGVLPRVGVGLRPLDLALQDLVKHALRRVGVERRHAWGARAGGRAGFGREAGVWRALGRGGVEGVAHVQAGVGLLLRALHRTAAALAARGAAWGGRRAGWRERV